MTDSPTGPRSLNYLDVVRQWIVAGEYSPGSPLREDQLAARLAASRTTVRKLLALLQHEELVVYHPNRGYQVRLMSPREIQQRLRVRAALEGLMCRVIASSGMRKELQGLIKGILNDCLSFGRRATHSEAPMRAYIDAINRFHALLRINCDNAFLVSCLEACRLFPVYVDSGWQWVEHEEFAIRRLPDLIVAANVDRARLVEALFQGEGVRAETLMREHFAMIAQGIQRMFDAGALVPDSPSRRNRLR